MARNRRSRDKLLVVCALCGLLSLGVTGVTSWLLLKAKGDLVTVQEQQDAQTANRRFLFVLSCQDRDQRWHEALESYRHLPRQPGQRRPPHYERVLEQFTDSTVGKIRPCRADARRRIRG